jgi:hypothetical protein
MAFCCEALAKEVRENSGFVGGGGLYPASIQPTGQIEQDDDGTWNVNGCCGGGCFVLTNVRFCPFCGTKLPTSDAGKRPLSE